MKLCKDCKNRGKKHNCKLYTSTSNYAERCKDFKQQKQTNFDYCCQSVENMAQVIDIAKCGWTKEQVIKWLQSEVEG